MNGVNVLKKSDRREVLPPPTPDHVKIQSDAEWSISKKRVLAKHPSRLAP